MKKGFSNYAYTLEQAGAIALGSKKTLLVSGFFFLTGIFTGLFMELTLAADEKSSMIGYLQQYLFAGSSAAEYPNPFFSSIINNLLLLLICFLAGLSAFGFPAALAAFAYKGLALGYCTGLIAESLKGKGLIVILTSLLPQNLILIPVFGLACCAAVNFGLCTLNRNQRQSKKNLKDISGSYLLVMLLCAAAVGLACGLEAILFPVVLLP